MAPRHSDERSLHRRLRRHEPQAQREFVDGHWEPVREFLARYVGIRRHDASEIASEVLCEFLVDPGVYDPERSASVRTWLLVVAKNRARDLLRKRSRAPRRVELPHDLRNRPGRAPTSESVAQAARLLQHVSEEVLTEEQRRIRWWRAYDIPYADIAEWTGRSRGALRQVVRRAKRRLRRTLAGLADELPALSDPEVRRHFGLEDSDGSRNPA